MVDRKARDELAAVIESYMKDEILSCDLDESASRIKFATSDEVVKTVANSLWLHYDDIVDHHIVVSRQQWDFFYRLLLLLKSDCELTVSSRWTIKQPVAALCLAGLAIWFIYGGLNFYLVVALYIFGFAALFKMGLFGWKQSEREKMEAIVAPFPSISNLLSVRRKVSEFYKIPYPKEFGRRRIRSKFEETIMLIPILLGAPLGCLILLFSWLFPEKSALMVGMET